MRITETEEAGITETKMAATETDPEIVGEEEEVVGIATGEITMIMDDEQTIFS